MMAWAKSLTIQHCYIYGSRKQWWEKLNPWLFFVLLTKTKCPALLLAIEHSIGQSWANGSTTKLKIQSTPVIMAFFSDFANKKWKDQ